MVPSTPRASSLQPTAASPELATRIAFSMLKGMTPQLAQEIEQRLYGEPQLFFTLSEHILAARLQTQSRMFDDAYRRQVMERAQLEAQYVASQPQIRPVYFSDDAYPQELLQCDDAPLMLYCTGHANLNASHKIAMIGTRSATEYGVRFIQEFVEELSKKLDDLLIISGLAYGCDITSHRAALANNVPTVGVVAHGLDMIYPAEHRKEAARMVAQGGGVITDYPHGSPVHKGNFLARNRIVAGMSHAIIVVQSRADRGGALHTAHLGAMYNRDVFAVPGRRNDIYNQGCHRLIRENIAHLLETPEQLIHDMGWKARAQEGEQQQLFPDLDTVQQAIYDHMRQHGDCTLQELLVLTNIPVGQLKAKLIDLELADILAPLPGSRFTLLR